MGHLLSSARIASTVWSSMGDAHWYTWYGVATRSKGCFCMRFFWTNVKFRLKAGDTMLKSSISEWQSRDGVDGRGLNTSSVDL